MTAEAPLDTVPPMTAKPSTNGLAVVSFVAAILTASLIAVITGHIALSQIKRSGQGGRGLALAGVIIGWTVLGLFALVIVLGVISGAQGPA